MTKSTVLINGFAVIDSYYFSGTNIEEVYIYGSDRSLGRNAFYGQENVMVYIPDSVTEIEVEVDGYGGTYEMDIEIPLYITADELIQSLNLMREM